VNWRRPPHGAGDDRVRGANLLLSIRDDGIGGADLTKGFGLIGLTDRVEALDGKMQISSAAGSVPK
jgi:signal transduction histidine kinase